MASQRALIVLATENLLAGGAGPIKAPFLAGRAIAFAWEMAKVCEERNGSWPTQAEFAEAHGVTERTVQREFRNFKRAFPGEPSPRRIGEAMLANRAVREADDAARALTMQLAL